MAGMFYNLQEIADKIGDTIEQAEELVKLHKLREFRDGSRVLYKTSEVDPLIVEVAPNDTVALTPEPEEEVIDLAPGGEEMIDLGEDVAEIMAEESAIDIGDDAGAAASEATAESVIETTEGEDTSQISIEDDTLALVPEEDTLAASGADSVANLLASDESEFDIGEMDTINEEAVSEDSINALLAEDSIAVPLDDAAAGSAADLISDLTSADTHGATTGINVLGESDADYQLSSDSKADTQDAEIEDEFGDLDDDINLDTVGSGSGLLDLSLQADDTSLGAVLDDILPAVEEGEGAMPSAEDFGIGDEGEGIFDDAQAGGGAMPVGVAVAAATRYVELPADAASNACGIALFFPITAIVFAIIVVVNGFRGDVVNLLDMVEEYLLWIVAGLGGVTLLIIIIGMVMGGGSGQPKAAKKKKEKKPKKKRKK